jgi:hypothetical protein
MNAKSSTPSVAQRVSVVWSIRPGRTSTDTGKHAASHVDHSDYERNLVAMKEKEQLKNIERFMSDHYPSRPFRG